mmetsp:Transcript_19213/g.45829  ORF Transcript_19213/g.45829 Transcript_19213/m.45829 type:complete len:95 (+) Transcript_19213:1506-1790(+)
MLCYLPRAGSVPLSHAFGAPRPLLPAGTGTREGRADRCVCVCVCVWRRSDVRALRPGQDSSHAESAHAQRCFERSKDMRDNNKRRKETCEQQND